VVVVVVAEYQVNQELQAALVADLDEMQVVQVPAEQVQLGKALLVDQLLVVVMLQRQEVEAQVL
jgi:hypothetical protein